VAGITAEGQQATGLPHTRMSRSTWVCTHFKATSRNSGGLSRQGWSAAPGARIGWNEELLASAEAAGLRECLTCCRPPKLPTTYPWSAPELVCQAVRLILAGALDQDTEVALAARVGLSGRHLRRLFVAHLGITPDGLARSCRAHFAWQLLDDTDLSITEIAFAAGYGSGRQFNREFQRIFKGTPSQHRASRSSPEQLAAGSGLTLRLGFTGPLDWDAVARSLAARAIPGVEHVDRKVYRRIIIVDSDHGVLELGPGGSDHLKLGIHLPCWETLVHVVAQARKIACLDEDTESLAGDSVIGPLLAARPSVRAPAAWDPFEAGIAAIIGQYLSPVVSQQVMGQIVTRFGHPITGLAALGLTHAFPTPRTLARAGTDLQASGLTGDQAETLRSFASATASDIIRLDRYMTSEQLITSRPGEVH
jgi:AraC family transcriptional regulator, regulatory protein of adaptative response / DNA-3-methyladenine glycosylase II